MANDFFLGLNCFGIEQELWVIHQLICPFFDLVTILVFVIQNGSLLAGHTDINTIGIPFDPNGMFMVMRVCKRELKAYLQFGIMKLPTKRLSIELPGNKTRDLFLPIAQASQNTFVALQ